MNPAGGRRARQAEATRHEIVGAARRLFAARGYAATSVRDVAAAAGVSVQTVYDSVGSKRALVQALNDVIDEEAAVGALVGQAMSSTDVDDVVRLGPRIMRAILERAGDIVRVAAGAAGADAALQSVQTEGFARHRAGAQAVVGRLRDRGVLRPDLDDDEAVEVLAALTDVAFGRMLRDQYGWSFDHIEQFVTDLVRVQLLAP